MRTVAAKFRLLSGLAFCLIVHGAGQVKLEYYGVNDIEPAQYQFLKDSLRGNFALVELKADSLIWKDVITKAEQNNISLVIWPLGHGERYTPWLSNVFSWDISEGLGAMLWAERYVQDVGYRYTPNNRFSKEPAFQGPGTGASAEGVLRNWLECMKARTRTVANEEEGYYSAVACCMANQAHRTQSRVVWDPSWDLPA